MPPGCAKKQQEAEYGFYPGREVLNTKFGKKFIEFIDDFAGLFLGQVMATLVKGTTADILRFLRAQTP